MTVKGEGDKNAKIYIIGECPGRWEEQTGRPFVGGAGKVLDGILREVGIDRYKTYIDNVIQDRPPKNDFSIHYKDKGRKMPTELLLRAQERVRRLISTGKPNVVVALGNESLYAITGIKGIMNYRGSLLNFNSIKVIPTIHPAMVMRQYEFRPIVVMDFAKIKKESITPNFPKPYNNRFILNPTFDKAMFYLTEVLPSKEYLTFDIETSNNQIMCIGFGWSKEHAICIPIFHNDTSTWTAEEENTIVIAIRKLFKSKAIKFIAQNAQFDLIYLADKWGVEIENLWMDTMLGFHCIYPELKKSLAFLCSIYTNRPFYKDMGKSSELLWEYNCLDAVVTWECAMAIRDELIEYKTFDFYMSNSHKLIKPLIAMQRFGCKIDMTYRKVIKNQLEESINQMQDKLNRVVGHELNVGSPKQMKDFLYEELKIPAYHNKQTGSITANENTLTKIASKYKNPVFSLIISIRKAKKLLSTYVDIELDRDNRIRCSYLISGTTTGRLSSRKSIYGVGCNLQNIPRDKNIRRMFIADNAMLLGNADLAQAEARVVAYVADDERLQKLFERGGDIHKFNASIIFNKGIAQVTPDERQIAKTLVHAANYGIGAQTFAKHVGCTKDRAQELLNHYYALYPEIKNWHRKVEDQLASTRTLVTPMGRKRTFFGRWGSDLIREAIAYVPQSTVSDVINAGIVSAYKTLLPGWQLLMQVHDSVVFQFPQNLDLKYVWKFIKYHFEFKIECNHKRFVIPITIKIGKNWGDMKEVNYA